MNKKIGAIIAVMIVLVPKTAVAQTQTACHDFPSCAVTGTVVVGGVLYYIIRNTVTGAIHRVPARQMPPAHRNNQGEDYIGKVISIGILRNKEACEEIAKQYSRERGGVWKVIFSNAGISTPEGSDGNIPSEQGYHCQIEKQS